MFSIKWAKVFALLVVATLILAACATPTPQIVEVTKVVEVEKEVTTIVKETVEVEKEVEVTKVVTKKETVQVEVTPTPTPVPTGGFMTEPSFADPDILNPLLSSDTASSDITDLIFEVAFPFDPWTGETVPTGTVENWEITDGNLTVTFHVRKGMEWSDGEPITAKDFKFMFDALMAVDDEGNPVLSESPRLDMVEYVDTVELIDDYTLKVTYTEPICTNFEVMSLRWLPSHVFLADADFEWADLIDHPFNWAPTVASGPFKFEEWVQDDHVTLVRNENYWKGAPYLDGYIYQIVANATVQKEMLKAGEVDISGFEAKDLAEMEQVDIIDIYKFFVNNYTYLGMQWGDPENPQPRLNEDGSLNEDHGSHPILSKKEVRQALTYALDRNAIIMQILFGQGAPIEAHIIPTYGWAFNEDLEPREYDPELAGQMLDEAGWPLNESTGIRECQGCGTTEDGTPFALNVKTNAGNETRENIIVLAQQQWGEIGIDVEVENVEWNAYLDILLGQTFDVVCIGWTGADPDSEVLFSAKYDLPGGGFNFCSFYHPDYLELELAAKSVEGCSYEDRGALYDQVQEIIYDELPYIFLYAPRSIFGINKRLGNVNPGPWSTYYNIHEWYVKP